LTAADFARGQLTVNSFARANRLFTVEQSVVLYVAGKISDAKFQAVRAKIRELFT
jgi:hypothetical protein